MGKIVIKRLYLHSRKTVQHTNKSGVINRGNIETPAAFFYAQRGDALCGYPAAYGLVATLPGQDRN